MNKYKSPFAIKYDTCVLWTEFSLHFLTSTRISVVFEGELAETAATHVKENHYIYVGGHLSGHRLPINMTNDQVNLQVVLCFSLLVCIIPW